jgi:hypothetical protein
VRKKIKVGNPQTNPQKVEKMVKKGNILSGFEYRKS